MSDPVPIDRGRRTTTEPAARTLPHNIEAEESLLGAMMLNREAVAVAAEAGITPADFYRPAHGHIFDAMGALAARGEALDVVTISDELRRHPDRLAAIGGPATLISVQARTPASGNAPRYARIVGEMATLRRLITTARAIADGAYEMPDDIEAAVDDAEAGIFAVRPAHATATARSLADGLVPWLDVIEERHNTGGIIASPTGFADLDEIIGGLHPGHLVIACGRPGSGKTSWAAQLTLNVAQRAPVLFASVEMSQAELTTRFVASTTGLVGSDIDKGRVAPRDWERIAGAIGPLSALPVEVVDSPSVTLMTLRTAARRATARMGPLGLLVVDYVQLMTGRAKAENRQVEVAEITRGLKVLGKELGVSVVALAQLNRGVEARSDKRPMLADLRETGELENSADVVVGLYRDEVYNRDTEDRGIAELLVLKNRHGPQGVVRLAADLACGRWANLARGGY